MPWVNFMKIKIAYFGRDTDFLNNTGEGIQRYGYELYNNLKENKNLDINVLSSKTVYSYVKDSFLNDFGKYDLIHITNFRLLSPKRRSKSVLLITAHDFQPILYPEFSYNPNNSSINEKLWFILVKVGLKRELKVADYLICNSTQTKDEAIKLGFDSKKVFITNLGIDNRFRKPIKNNKNKRNFTVGYLGAMRKRKNLEFAIKAANIIKNQNINFYIWGKKEHEYEFIRSIAKNKNIKFKGFAPEEKIVSIYDSFDAFVFPSYHEGQGLPILEAQSRELPVIIYKYGKIPKEIRKYCFEAESPEHMAQIIEDLKENGYNEKLSKKATEYARSFTGEKCARETLEVYKKVLK